MKPAPIALAVTCALVCLALVSRQQVDRAAAVAALREDLELDLVRDAVAKGRAWTAEDGAFCTDGEVLALYARALATSGDDEGARACLAAAKPDEATRPWIAIELARQALEQDDLAAAAAALAGADATTVKYPELAECWLVRARALARLGEPVRAAPLFEKFLSLAPLSPDGPAACHQIAQAALARGAHDEARRWFDRAAELGTWQGFYRARRIQIREHPDDPLPKLGLAELLLDAREHARAETLLAALVTAKPEVARAWFLLGEARRKQRNLDGAQTAYDRALQLDPTLAFARFNRAVIARMAGRAADARADFERIVAEPSGDDPRLAAAHLELSRLLVQAGEKEAAARRYARYVALGGKEPLEARR
jgi:tetratricopeptide (TPR) repeat protein